jgi:RNA polymerase sigma-70 factor, ECF subfamily
MILGVSESTALRYQQSDPDVRLMLRVSEDDAGAFAELVGRYEARLVRLMRAMGPSPDQAEDLAQETFLRIFRARHRYVPGAKFSTYLYTVAGNVARNAARTVNRRHEVRESDGVQSSSESGAYSMVQSAADASGLMPTRLVEQNERAEMVRLAVEQLNERQKMALMLSRFEHMNYAEIAEAMGLTTKAVKSLLSRARVSLKEQLRGFIEESPGLVDDSNDNETTEGSF